MIGDLVNYLLSRVTDSVVDMAITQNKDDTVTGDAVPDGNKGALANYIENIKLSTSTLMLSATKPQQTKDDQLLNESKTAKQFSPVWRQTLCASSSILLTLAAGLTSGYSAILLPQLKQPDSRIPGDDHSASWIAAMAALPMAPGCLLAGWMMERFGRKMSHYLICAPFLIGWVLIACANNLALMLLGRFFTGLCVGLLGPLGPVYIGECSDPRYRGFFLAGVSLAIAVGILVAHVVGTFLSWQATAIVCSAFPVLAVLLLTVVPESPAWLISRGRVEEGVRAFGWLRGYSDEVNKELKALMEKQKAAEMEPKRTTAEQLRALGSPELLKPLGIMIVFFVTCQFSGVNAVAFYSIEIVERAVGKGLDHYVAMLVIDGVRVVVSAAACVMCRRWGRRPLCVVSGVWAGASLLGLAGYLQSSATGPVWIPLTCLVSYICAVSVGLVPLPWIMCGELFPARVRGLGSGISSATTFASFFIVVKTAPAMMATLGEVVTFGAYGAVALAGTAILFLILPETRGKSLQEIEDRFRAGKKADSAA